MLLLLFSRHEHALNQISLSSQGILLITQSSRLRSRLIHILVGIYIISTLTVVSAITLYLAIVILRGSNIVPSCIIILCLLGLSIC